MIILQDLERACEESGASIIAVSDSGATISIPDLATFGCALGQRNTEWDEEAHNFLGTRVVSSPDVYRFEYTITDSEE